MSAVSSTRPDRFTKKNPLDRKQSGSQTRLNRSKEQNLGPLQGLNSNHQVPQPAVTIPADLPRSRKCGTYEKNKNVYKP